MSIASFSSAHLGDLAFSNVLAMFSLVRSSQGPGNSKILPLGMRHLCETHNKLMNDCTMGNHPTTQLLPIPSPFWMQVGRLVMWVTTGQPFCHPNDESLDLSAYVTTVTKPTPIRPIPTCLRPSRVIRITPKHPISIPNPLALSQANSCLRNALLDPLTPLHFVDAFPTCRSFDLSPSSRQVDSQHPHSFPTRCHSTFSLSCIKFIPDISLILQLRSGEARSHTSLAQCILVCLFLPSIYLYVPLCLIVRYPSFVPPSHPQFPISINPCLIYL